MIVNLLKLEQSFETHATSKPVEASRNVAHVSKLHSKVSKFTIIFFLGTMNNVFHTKIRVLCSALASRLERHRTLRRHPGGLSNLQCLLGADSCEGHTDSAFDLGSRVGVGQFIGRCTTGCAQGGSCDFVFRSSGVMSCDIV